MRAIDVCHQGREHVICAWQVDDVIVDPGPESSVDTLLDALGDEQPRALLLTHIHFDHAGAAGRARARLARPRGLGPRARRAPPRRPDAPRRVRQAPVRRRLRPPVGRGRADPAGEPARAARRRVDRRLGRRLHARPRLAPRLLPPSGQRLGVRRRHRRRAAAARRPAAAADAAAGVRPRRLARVDRHDRGVGAAGAGDHAFRRLRRRRRAPRPPARGARAAGPSWPRAPTATATPTRCAPSLRAALDERDAPSFAQAMPPEDQWLGIDRYFSRLRDAGATG